MQDLVLEYAGTDGCSLYASVEGDGPLVILLHGGGPDHRSLLPLASRLTDAFTVALPDVRGYGRSVCADPGRHTWDQYAQDVVSLIDALGVDRAVVGGTGLGGTIALRTARSHPGRAPTLIFPGGDARHPARTATLAVNALPDGRLAPVGISVDLQTAEDLADTVAPAIRDFLRERGAREHRP